MTASILVVAKAPVAGEVKTRLGAIIGMEAAAELAAAALLDTLDAAAQVGPCHLALAGGLDRAIRGREIREALEGWTVFAQEGDDFAQRLVHAHRSVKSDGFGVIQIGMDTPQVTPDLLTRAGAALGQGADAVLGPAEDGGWWLLGLSDGAQAAALRDVPMSRPNTRARTEQALRAAGAVLATVPKLRDVDEFADAVAIAAAAPGTRFSRLWYQWSEAAS